MNNLVRLVMQFFFSISCWGMIFSSVYAADFPATSLAERNYLGLQQKLALYQNAVLHPWPLIPATQKKLKRGMKNSVIPLLRTRLKITGDLPSYYERFDNVFDLPLTQAVKNFQTRNGLSADGIVGQDTLRALNITPAARVKQIIINMQRWVSLSSYLQGRFILVNVPDYELYAYDNNALILSMKAIVGKPNNETPELQSRIVRLVFNPYWNVPNKIAQNEIIKKVQENPAYLDETQMKILTNEGEDALEVNPEEINWYAIEKNAFPYRFRQEPGLDNSLGLVKFEFQNAHDIYLHDTPIKELFNQDKRALSHGCIRLENPFGLVDYLMEGNPEWSEDRLQEILSTGKTKYIKAYRSTPVIIAYITAWVDETGAINFRDDIYGKDN